MGLVVKGEGHGLVIFELSLGVDVVNTDVFQLVLVTEIDTFDVVLDILSKDLPIVGNLKLTLLPGDFPSVVFPHLHCLFDLSGDVKELFRNTSDINACTTQTPL